VFVCDRPPLAGPALRRSRSGAKGGATPKAYYAPVAEATVSSSIILDGTGMVEIPFSRVQRFSNGLAVEVLVLVSEPPGPGAKSFIAGSAGTAGHGRTAKSWWPLGD
jgi:hypothetical protein